jgi:hypothetical protein
MQARPLAGGERTALPMFTARARMPLRTVSSVGPLTCADAVYGISNGSGRAFGDSRGCLRWEPRSPFPLGMGSMSLHLTCAKLQSRILRADIRPEVKRFRSPGVFAMPLTPKYVVSHQWARELRKWGRGSILAVYFRVPDDEPVMVGHYSRLHAEMTAAQAVAAIMRLGAEALSSEVIIPCGIPPEAIIRTPLISSQIGWRHFPGAHGRRPCGCPACVARGQYKSRRLRKVLERDQRP